MLLSLKITNIALIEDIEIQFKKGLNILSGETGAGKSIILDAIAMISGEHAKTDLIRTGKDEAKILAIFDLEENKQAKIFLEELGIDTQENILIIERHIFKDKRPSLAFVNHKRTLIHILKDIGLILLDIHSQHENQELFDAQKHLEILDKYQNIEELLKSYQKDFQYAITLKKELQELQTKKIEQEEKAEFFQFQLEEIQNTQLSTVEYETLQEQLASIELYIERTQELQKIYDILYENEQYAVKTLLKESLYSLESSIFKPEITQDSRNYLNDILVKLDEVIEFIREQKSIDNLSPEEVEEKKRRYQQYQELQAKYKRNISELLEYQNELEEKLGSTGYIDEKIIQIEKEREELKQLLIKKALEISVRRHEGSEKLVRAIQQELEDLQMYSVDFDILFQSIEDPLSNITLPDGRSVRLLKDGLERVEFFVSFNKGEEKKSLSKVGSGGEISRLTLAIKKILNQISPVTTQIFDEVDSGIGGEAAFAVGKKLLEISTHKQVVCITHLPQIAAMGEIQYLVKKTLENSRTQTTIELLNDSERIYEISRMLSGESHTSVSLDHAKELLDYRNSKNLKKL